MSANLYPFFILGNPRSGTSMFRLMLNRHSEIVVPPECGYILWYHEAYESVDFLTPSVLKAFVSDVCKAKKFETWEVGHSALLQFLIERKPKRYSDACALVHQFYAMSRGKTPSVWGDKNNYYISESLHILQLYPDAKFLFLIRDPRDVFASYVDLSNLKTDSKYVPRLTVSTEEFSEEWNSNLKHLEALAARLPPEKFKYVRYEDVILEPVATMQGVLDFLGLDLEESVLMPGKDSRFIEREPAGTLDWKKLTTKAPDKSRVGRYRSTLNLEQIGSIQEACKVGLRRFKYGSV